jgi:DNA-binding transcriptional ArsR family regulator
MSHEHQLRGLLARGELLSSREIARRTGLSQPTVSRALSRMTDAILIGAGRGARFGLLRQIGNHGDHWPVYRVAEKGDVEKLGTLRALAGDCWIVEFERNEPLYSLGLKNGISEGWPWFLDELRPQGFMGRAFAQRVYKQLGAQADLNLWNPDQFLLASYIFGGDLPGNLMVGEHSIRIPDPAAESEWTKLAMESVKGRPPGSSAGGERPKFSVGLELVKFAGKDDQHGRWADLLIAEATAGEVLRHHGIPAAASRIVEVENFVFLAVRRFDRTESGGRVGLHSLAAIDGALYGEGSGSWADMAEKLFKDGLISLAEQESIQQVWNFGRAIRNTDMHFGNLGFYPNGEGFMLAPVYDMLPMGYAPHAAGLPEYEHSQSNSREIRTRAMVKEYWEKLSLDPRLSESFRTIARLHQSEVSG